MNKYYKKVFVMQIEKTVTEDFLYTLRKKFSIGIFFTKWKKVFWELPKLLKTFVISTEQGPNELKNRNLNEMH